MLTPQSLSALASRALRALVVLAALLPTSAFATNLVTNPGFDGGTAGWTLYSEPGSYSSQWRSEDATGDSGSGSIGIQHLGDVAGAYLGVTQCLVATGGASYSVQGRLRIPVGQAASGGAEVTVTWYAAPGCATGLVVAESPLQLVPPGNWLLEAASVVAPLGAQSVRLELAAWVDVVGTTLVADFDDLRFDDGAVGDPPPPYGKWLASGDLPGYEAQVRITGGSPVEGAVEHDCIDETICVSGALTGRPEVFIKVIGPRPNGFYWAQLIRFTPSQVEVWLRRVGGTQTNYYLLGVTVAGVLRGVEDREAFLP